MIKKRKYSFISRWQIKAPIEAVWDAIYESEHWPEWWKGVTNVEEIAKGNTNGVDSIRNYTIVSPALYKLKFSLILTDNVEHRLLRGNAAGELEGTGTWLFSERDGITCVECHWIVTTNVAWMNLFAFLLAPFFRYNHKLVMRKGASCLATKLNSELIFVE